MSQQVTPETAREALASADRMARAGHKRAWWPRWATMVESALLAAMIIASGLKETAIGGKWVLILIALVLAGGAFRSWCLRKFGVMAQPNAIDAGMIVLLLAAMAGAFYLPKLYVWAPWAIGIGYAVLRMIRHEFGRRRQPAAMAQDGKS